VNKVFTEKSRLRKGITGALLAIALLMLIGAGVRSYRVLDPNTVADDFGIPTFLRVSEPQMTMDSTFHGVDRRDGKLYTTYDRLAGPGKRACPT
jgi:hypothetical protein